MEIVLYGPFPTQEKFYNSRIRDISDDTICDRKQKERRWICLIPRPAPANLSRKWGERSPKLAQFSIQKRVDSVNAWHAKTRKLTAYLHQRTKHELGVNLMGEKAIGAEIGIQPKKRVRRFCASCRCYRDRSYRVFSSTSLTIRSIYFNELFRNSLPAMVFSWLNVQHRPEDIELQAQQQNARRAGGVVAGTARITLTTVLRRTEKAQIPALSRVHAVPHHGVLGLGDRCRIARPSGGESSPLLRRLPSRRQSTRAAAIFSSVTHGTIAKVAHESFTPSSCRMTPPYGSARMTFHLDR